MNKFKQITSIVLGLILISGMGYVLYWLGLKLLGIVTTLKPEIVATVIGAMVTVLGGLAAVIISNKQSKQREIDESHRAKKVEIYKGFLDVVSGMMTKENKNVSNRGLSDQELADYFVKFKMDLLLWGSPKVIKYQLEFERFSTNSDKVFTAVNNLYKAIREDIGLSNKGLDNHELVKIHLRDPSELDDILAANK